MQLNYRIYIIYFITVFYGACLASIPAMASAELIVSGETERTPSDQTLTISIDELERLGMTKVVTTTPWHEGIVTFEGVKASTLAEYLGVKGESVYAFALNDYFVEIPVSDFEEFDPIFATRINGERIDIKELGPIIFIYPFDDQPKTKSGEFYNKSIWHLKEIKILK